VCRYSRDRKRKQNLNDNEITNPDNFVVGDIVATLIRCTDGPRIYLALIKTTVLRVDDIVDGKRGSCYSVPQSKLGELNDVRIGGQLVQMTAPQEGTDEWLWTGEYISTATTGLRDSENLPHISPATLLVTFSASCMLPVDPFLHPLDDSTQAVTWHPKEQDLVAMQAVLWSKCSVIPEGPEIEADLTNPSKCRLPILSPLLQTHLHLSSLSKNQLINYVHASRAISFHIEKHLVRQKSPIWHIRTDALCTYIQTCSYFVSTQR
jgi:hypothetical protein